MTLKESLDKNESCCLPGCFKKVEIKTSFSGHGHEHTHNNGPGVNNAAI